MQGLHQKNLPPGKQLQIGMFVLFLLPVFLGRSCCTMRNKSHRSTTVDKTELKRSIIDW